MKNLFSYVTRDLFDGTCYRGRIHMRGQGNLVKTYANKWPWVQKIEVK